jgi:maltose phosphorylase
MEYAGEAAEYVKKNDPEKYRSLIEKLQLNENVELGKWNEIRSNMYFPTDEKLGIFLQQEGYMDKEQILVKDLDPKQRPINQKWSWDRILRSCFIKQADVLQGLYFLEDRFDIETIRRNFEFYEARTVHESSLSPCVHSVQAALLGKIEKAYELYVRTARLDLDDYNHEVKEGLHITSMAGTWISIVEGFGGMRVRNDMLTFNPLIPEQWQSFSFKVWFRENLLRVNVSKGEVTITNEEGPAINVMVFEKLQIIGKEEVLKVSK